MDKQNTVVISLGGSLMVPDRLDIDFLRSFKSLILSQVEKGRRFVIICGGGMTSRVYQDAAEELGDPAEEDLDWLGIYGTRLNAYLLWSALGDAVYEWVVVDPAAEIETDKPIVVAGGWKPGASTDLDSIILAANFGADTVINLTNIDYVYDKDPDKHKDAKPLKDITWKEFRRIIPTGWEPGLHSPFDPIAAKEADRGEFEVVIINGNHPDRLADFLDKDKLVGTRIR